MAKKPVLPNIGALIGAIKPYGDGETDSGRPAQVLLQSIRLDPGQPRRLLPADLAGRVQRGELSLIQAMQAWAKAAGVPLLPDALAPEMPDALEEASASSAAARGDEPEALPGDARLQRVRQLAASIIHVGLIHPVNVIPQADGAYLLETGERRVLAMAWLAACGLSEYERVPALFVSQSASHRARQVTENMSREDLSAVEKARGLWNSRYELSGLPSPDWNDLTRRATAPAAAAGAAGAREQKSKRSRASASVRQSDSHAPPRDEPAHPLDAPVSLAEMLEHPGLVPWADVERHLSIGKRYRIWLTQTLELSPQAIVLIEQYRLPERATRPLVQLLRNDPAGQVAVLQALASAQGGGSETRKLRDARSAGSKTKGPLGKQEAGSSKQAVGGQGTRSPLIPHPSLPTPDSSSLTAEAIEVQAKQYLAGKASGAATAAPAAGTAHDVGTAPTVGSVSAAGSAHATVAASGAGRPAAVASEQLAGETRLVLATRRALQSLQRAMGPRGLNQRTIRRIVAQLAADAGMVQQARRIKPLVDALAGDQK